MSHTPCTCQVAGYCPRWDREVTRIGHQVCQTGSARQVETYFGTDAPEPPPTAVTKSGARVLSPLTYVTIAQLMDDARTLAARLPADVDLVVGVARSGLLPAGLVATWLHVPLRVISHDRGLTEIGGGGRMQVLPNRDWSPTPKIVALIDDTAASGREMRRLVPLVRAAYPDARIIRAVVYAHPRGRRQVDVCVAEYPGPHYLEWNIHNSGHAFRGAYDFDGVLCRDIAREDDDDGPRYRLALEHAVPLNFPRRTPISLIVTARHERYRAITEAWLARHAIRCERLVMRDWEYANGRHDAQAVAEWKGRVYREASNPLFIESSEREAPIIAQHSGKRVLCPAAGRAFEPPPIPSLARRAANLTKASARHVRKGRKKATAEVLAQRLATCATCVPWYDPTRGVCRHKKCGCKLRVKASWEDAQCPVQNW